MYSICTCVAADCPRISSSCRRAIMSRPTALPVILPAVLAIFTMSLGSERNPRNHGQSDQTITSETCRFRPRRKPSSHRSPPPNGRSGNRNTVARRVDWIDYSLIMTEQAPRMTSSWPVENPSIFAARRSGRCAEDRGEEGRGRSGAPVRRRRCQTVRERTGAVGRERKMRVGKKVGRAGLGRSPFRRHLECVAFTFYYST